MLRSFKSYQDSNFQINWLLSALDDMGLDLFEIKSKFDLMLLEEKEHDIQVEIKKYQQILEHSSNVKNDNTFGLTLAKNLKISGLGLIGYLLSNASDIAEAMDTLTVYTKLIDPHVKFSFNVKDGIGILEYTAPYSESKGYQLDVDLTFASIVLLINEFVSEEKNWHPSACKFTYFRTKAPHTHTSMFGKNIIYGHHVNQLEFPEKILNFKKNNRDSTLFLLLKSQANKELTQISSSFNLVEYIEKIIVNRLGEEVVTREVIADLLNMSQRSLNRYLQIEKTSFKEIKNRVVINSAKKALTTGKMQIAEIALWLGYSESSAFIRHFKKVTGITPRHFKISQIS